MRGISGGWRSIGLSTGRVTESLRRRWCIPAGQQRYDETDELVRHRWKRLMKTMNEIMMGRARYPTKTSLHTHGDSR